VLRFLLLVIALIVYGSLYPFQFTITPAAAHPLTAVWNGWPLEWDRFVFRDVALNIILYTAPGFAAAMAALRSHSRALSAAAATGLAFALSVSMELLQVYEPVRDPSSLDVLTNTLGGALGAGVAIASERRLRRLNLRALRGPGAVLLAVWALAEFYPLFPSIGRTHLQESLATVMQLKNVSAVETWLGVAEWLAVGVAIEAAAGRARTVWLAGLMLATLAAQTLIADRNLASGEVISAALALPLWHFAPPHARAKWCAWMLGSAILLRQMQPFYFLSVPQGFSWTPFAATLESGREAAVVVIARKAFDYAAMVFVLRRTGWRYAAAGIAVAAALAATEAIQTYLPGRTPEITDPLLALIMTAALVIAEPRKVPA
jgi:VanZ family protein